MSVRQRRDGKGSASKETEPKKSFNIFQKKEKSEVPVNRAKKILKRQTESDKTPEGLHEDNPNIKTEKVPEKTVTKIESNVAGVMPVISEIIPIEASESKQTEETVAAEEEIKKIDFQNNQEVEDADTDNADEDEQSEEEIEEGSDEEEGAEPKKRKVSALFNRIKKTEKKNASKENTVNETEEDEEEDEFEDSEVEALLEGFENSREARSERKRRRRERRKENRRSVLEFFRQKPDIKAVFKKKPDVRSFLKGKIQELRALKLEAERAQDLDTNARIQIEQNKQRIRLVAAGVMAVVFIVGIAVYGQVRVFHHYAVISTQERSDDSATVYVNMNRYRLKCNPNGVTCVDSKNNVIWNTTFTMQSLMVEQCGSLVAVAGQRGSEIYIFDEKGLVSSFNVEHTLMKMKLTKQGDVATVLEDGQVTWINIYNKNGTLLVKDKTTMAVSGYPLDMDISSDGHKMMVSFLGVGDDIESRVKFYNFSAVGQDSDNKLVNEEVYKSRVIPEVKFMDRNYAIAFGDDGVTVFRGNQIPEECNSVEVQDEIISTFSNDRYFGFITDSDEDPEGKEVHKYKMTIYRENGSKCGTAYFNFDYTSIAVGENQIVLYDNEKMKIYDMAGKLKCSTSYEGKQISTIVPTNSIRKYTVLTENSIDLIKVK